jgi:hypothetical protein
LLIIHRQSIEQHSRPIHELLAPNWKDQAQAIATQFEGMKNENFTYALYEQTRVDLMQAIHKNLTDSDKNFFLSFKNLEADCSI